jgi:hypothetical protein
MPGLVKMKNLKFSNLALRFDIYFFDTKKYLHRKNVEKVQN